jgi:alpha-glucosidase (family GH31 glycosyl hydrolase)
MEFQDDINTYKIDRQGMLGSSLLISPVLADNSSEATDLYFPVYI